MQFSMRLQGIVYQHTQVKITDLAENETIKIGIEAIGLPSRSPCTLSRLNIFNPYSDCCLNVIKTDIFCPLNQC